MADFGEGNCPFRYPSDPLMFIAWRDFIGWATVKRDFREAFTAETGKSFYAPPKNGLEAMIDKACGVETRDVDIMPDFIEWLNVTQWGEDEVQIQPLPSDKRSARDA